MDNPLRKVVVKGIDGSLFKGSFAVSLTATAGDEKVFVGYQSVFARWNPTNCVNCNRSPLTVTFDIGHMTTEEILDTEFEANFHHRGDELPDDLAYDIYLDT